MKKIIPIIVMLIICGVFVSAQACSSPPSIPTSFTGNVFCEDGTFLGNFNLMAYLNGYGNLGTVGDGDYSIDVSSCFGSSSGTISFFINGIKANEEPEYNGQEDFGKEINLNLTFDVCPSSENLCGNEIKDIGEVCDGNNFGGLSCSNYGFDSGNLRCSDSCVNIYIDGCYISSTSNDDDDSSSSPSSSKTPIQTTSNDNLNSEDAEISSNENQETTSPGITGGVIGFAKTGKGIGLIFGLLIIVLGIEIITISRKKLKKKEEN